MVSFRVTLCCQGQGIVGVLQHGRHSTAWNGGSVAEAVRRFGGVVPRLSCERLGHHYWPGLWLLALNDFRNMILGQVSGQRQPTAQQDRGIAMRSGHHCTQPLHTELGARGTRMNHGYYGYWEIYGDLANTKLILPSHQAPSISIWNCRMCFWRPISVALEIETMRKTCCFEIHCIMDQQYIYIYIYIHGIIRPIDFHIFQEKLWELHMI